MATTKDYKAYLLEQLNPIGDITYRPMMGEYLLYYQNVLIGGIYDNRFLIKITNSNQKYQLEKQVPYQNAKEMYEIKDFDNMELIKEIITVTKDELKDKKKKK